MRPDDHDERMRVAKRWARWHLGSASWAEAIIEVYENHEAAAKNLARAMGEAPDAES